MFSIHKCYYGIVILAILIVIVGFLFVSNNATFAATISAPSNTPSGVQINQTFSFNATLTGIQSGETYFVKCRLGQSTPSLTEGQTYNSTTNTWLSDNGSWIDMPTITASGTSINVSIACRVKSGATIGQKLLYSSACLKKSDGTCGSGTSFKSSSGINLTATEESSTSPSPSPSTTTLSSTFAISNTPPQIDSTQIFIANVNLSLPSNPNAKLYLKGAFRHPDKPSNYFGLTKNGSSWIKNGSSYSDHYQITTDGSGSWSGSLDVQPDVLDSGYEGSGNYLFKVGRYLVSSSGNVTGPTWSNEVNIKINTKEIEVEDDGVINLSNTSKKSSKEVLGEKSIQDLPESIYSLENYKRVSSNSATPSGFSTIQPKTSSPNIILPVAGGILIGAGIGIGSYLFLKSRIKY